MFRVPDSVVTRRPISLNGAVVPAGTTLSKAQVESLGKGLNALLDSGYIVAAPDPFARKGKSRPQPTSLPPVIRNAMVKKLNGPSVPLSLEAKVAGKSVSVEVTGGVPSFTVTIDGEDAQTKSSRTFAFMVDGVGTHEAKVVDGAGAEASAFFTIIIGADTDEPKKPHRKKDEAEG